MDPGSPSVNITFLLDTSGSMIGERINQLNAAMIDAVQIAEDSAMALETQLFMRVVQFSTNASWYMGDKESGLPHIDWKSLSASGGTDTAAAIGLARSIMNTSCLGYNNYQPVVILITDGGSNDPEATKKAAEDLKHCLKNSAGQDRIMCVAIGVKGAVRSELEAFATVGTIKYSDTDIRENVPYVFEIQNIDQIRNLLVNVTKSTIASSVHNAQTASNPDIKKGNELILTPDQNGTTWADDGLVGNIPSEIPDKALRD